MGWELGKESWEDKLLRLTELINNATYKYYELFEPSKLGLLSVRLAEIQEHLVADEALACRELDELIKIWERELARIGVDATGNDIKSIHITLQQLGIGDEQYRQILREVSGKGSSRELKHYEAMIVLRRLHEINKASNK